jgi:hypothetical protein
MFPFSIVRAQSMIVRDMPPEEYRVLKGNDWLAFCQRMWELKL